MVNRYGPPRVLTQKNSKVGRGKQKARTQVEPARGPWQARRTADHILTARSPLGLPPDLPWGPKNDPFQARRIAAFQLDERARRQCQKTFRTASRPDRP